MSTEPPHVKGDVASPTGSHALPGAERANPRRRHRWRNLVWATQLAVAVVLWSFLIETGVARSIGAWADLLLIAWSALVVEGFTAAILDGIVDRGADPRVAAASWTSCARCGGQVPLSPRETQARCPFCDAAVLPPTGKRSFFSVRALLAGATLLGAALALPSAQTAPPLEPARARWILAATCAAALAWPFRRYRFRPPA